MSTELATCFPEAFAAGTTVKYRRTLADYPASAGNTLRVYLGAAKVLEARAEADEDSFLVAFTAAATATLAAGIYHWAERLTNADEEVIEVGAGVTTVTPNIAMATDGELQEWAELAIAALKAHISGRLPDGLQSYTTPTGIQISKLTIPDAMRVLAQLEARLARAANPDSFTRPVLVSFTGPGYDR